MPEEQIQDQPAQPDFNTQLQEAIWEGKPQPKNDEPPKPDDTPADPPKDQDDTEVLNEADFIKREFGIDDINVLKSEREEYKKLKETADKPFELKFANENSKKLYEALVEGKEDVVYDLLDKKMKLSSADKLNAADAIKMNLALKNQHYSQEDINDVFSEKYTHPKQPVQSVDETDEEFKERTTEWKSEVEKINRRIERDAKDAKIELGKMTMDLVYPDIPKKEVQPTVKEPTPEELEKSRQFKESFLKSADEAVKNFSGFAVPVKDKDVDYSINYANSQEEKDFISNQIKAFAENNYNVNAILADRWVNEDGSLKADQMTKDLSMLYYGEKALQKVGVDSAGRRLEEYLKEKKNIKIEPQNNSNLNLNDDKTESQKLQEHFWAN